MATAITATAGDLAATGTVAGNSRRMQTGGCASHSLHEQTTAQLARYPESTGCGGGAYSMQRDSVHLALSQQKLRDDSLVRASLLSNCMAAQRRVVADPVIRKRVATTRGGDRPLVLPPPNGTGWLIHSFRYSLATAPVVTDEGAEDDDILAWWPVSASTGARTRLRAARAPRVRCCCRLTPLPD